MSSEKSDIDEGESTASSFTESCWDAKKEQESLHRRRRHQSPAPSLLQKRRYPPPIRNSESQNIPENALKPKSEVEHAVLADCIQQAFIFENLQSDEQQALVAAFEKFTLRKNEVLYYQGDETEYWYMVYSGQVVIEVDGKAVNIEAGETHDDASSDRYQIFGQMALLTGSPSTETVKAISMDCVVFGLSQTHFQRALTSSRQQESDLTQVSRQQLLKSHLPPELLQYLQDDDRALQSLASGMIIRPFHQDDIFYPNNHCLTVIISGKVISKLNGYEDLYIGPGEAQSSFGWRNFSSQQKARTVGNSLRALSDGDLIQLSPKVFVNAFGNHGGTSLLKHLAAQRTARIQLQQITAFADSELDTHQIDGLIDLMHHYEYSATTTLDSKEEDDVIILQSGEFMEPALYFVREGRLLLEMKHQETQIIEQDGYFGDKYMLLDQNTNGKKTHRIRSPMTIKAQASPITRIDVLYLHECRNVVDTTLLGLGKATLSPIDTSIQWSNIRRHYMLGEGGFGQVWLASLPEAQAISTDDRILTNEISKRRIVAVKVQSKHHLVEQSHAKEACAERNVMASLHSPFIIQLFSSFQDKYRLYMVTSCMPGGELSELIPENGLSECRAKFYAAGIMEGLAFMHRHHILHRDIKPPNVLIDGKGYPVLIDLGFAKYVPNKSYTFCGTPMFVSPEIIRRQGHDKTTDYWSWAVLVYKMVHGKYPFRAPTESLLYTKICKAAFVSHGGYDLRSLMVAILYPDPQQRLGAAPNGWKDIFGHAWFQNDNDSFDLELFRKQELPAPWIPSQKDSIEPTSVALAAPGLMESYEQLPVSKEKQQIFESFGPFIDIN